MIYAFIDEERESYPVVRLCRVLAVSASGYYAWRQRPPSQRRLADQGLVVRIRAIQAGSRQTYGSPRVQAELRAQGERCNHKRVERLIRQNGLQVRLKRRYRVVTTQVDPSLPVAPNRLAQTFQATAANQTWLSDITYVPTGDGWLYLATVMDLYSRRIVGWSLAERLTTPLVKRALQMAVGRRRPAAGVIHHSDRGSQYASAEYRAELALHRPVASMSRSGNCYDNAPMESFFATLKSELIHRCTFSSRAQARQEIVSYIEGFYNPTRRHSALGYRSPMEFESATALA
ncbi:MAG: IS3 family transposase [Chloroflexi bacterium]|nr:IS3 family transposase [Chloroflexota bacterium]